MIPDDGSSYGVKEHDYMIFDDEFSILFNHVKLHYSMKMQLYLLFARFMGMRSIEILFIEARDFFYRHKKPYLRFRCAKTKVVLERPVPDPVFTAVYEYLSRNPLILSYYEGCLFYRKNGSRFKGKPVIKSCTMGAFMGKWRKALKDEHPCFSERNEFHNFYCDRCKVKYSKKDKYLNNIKGVCPDCGGFLIEKVTWIYRIHLHSIRHAYETQAINYCENPYWIQKLMGYTDIRTASTYISKRKMEDKIPHFVKYSVTPMINSLLNFSPDQTFLSDY